MHKIVHDFLQMIHWRGCTCGSVRWTLCPVWRCALPTGGHGHCSPGYRMSSYPCTPHSCSLDHSCRSAPPCSSHWSSFWWSTSQIQTRHQCTGHIRCITLVWQYHHPHKGMTFQKTVGSFEPIYTSNQGNNYIIDGAKLSDMNCVGSKLPEQSGYTNGKLHGDPILGPPTVVQGNL